MRSMRISSPRSAARARGAVWEEAPFTSLIAIKDGEIVHTSPPHGNEYIYNPNDYRMVYMDFARL